MNIRRHLALALAFCAGAAAISEAAPKAAPLSIKPTGWPIKELLVDAPDGAKVEQKATSIFVSAGAHFSIGLARSTPRDIEGERKASLTNGAVVDTNSPDVLLWHQDLAGMLMYNFIVTAHIGKDSLICTGSTLDNQIYSKADCDQMIAACKSVRKK